MRRWRSFPPGRCFLVANEFFDALPIRQFVRIGDAWRERVVGLDANGGLAFGIGAGRLDGGPDAAEGDIFEVRPAGEAIVTGIAERIVADGGAALIIDYGHAATAAGDTLQAVRKHAFADPLDAPGEADLTSHVDFAALARAAKAERAAVHGPITQGEFLLVARDRSAGGATWGEGRCGAGEALRAAVERLTARNRWAGSSRSWR